MCAHTHTHTHTHTPTPLQFAVRCQNIHLAPHINVVEAPGFGGFGGGANGELMEQLLGQVCGRSSVLFVSARGPEVRVHMRDCVCDCMCERACVCPVQP